MALISIIEDFHPLNNAKLLDRAAELKPSLHYRIVEPVGGFQLKERYSPEKEDIVLHKVKHLAMGRGENLCLDFGTHLVGYVTLSLNYTGSHPDAPAFLKLKFAECLDELSENSGEYNGWISRSWIQEEYIHVDVIPSIVKLPRRYAFRYLKITMMDTSPKYKLIVRHAECMTETSANYRTLQQAEIADPQLRKIDEVGVRTLANCMQDVFEDGPKRDQRLWMGDLRLQALVNSATFRHMNLVKRCLYLFGGSRFPDGRVSACIFTKPSVQADDTWLFDYSLFYTVTLEEYLEETGDGEALDDLYDVAQQQVEIALRGLAEGHLVSEDQAKNAFIDWADALDRRAAAQAVLICAVRYARRLARRRNDWSQMNYLAGEEKLLKEAALRHFWDPEKRCFVSGGQISIASQVWMVLADVLPPEEAEELMGRAEEFLQEVPMLTPYMHHYYLMALLRSGHRKEAEQHLREYWGSMIGSGADTFREAWDPEHPDASPYGGAVVNSCCHAWSCTPSWIIRTQLKES